MITKPDMTRVWAAGAPGGNVEDPDVTTPGKFDDGWVAEIPPFENFNFLQQLFTQGLAYLNEQGLGVYDAITDYPIGGVAKGSDGNTYQATIANGPASAVQDPVGDVSGTWGVIALWSSYTDGGIADAYVLTPTGANVKVPYDGMRAKFFAGNATTGASTVDFIGFDPNLAPKDIVLQDGTNTIAGSMDAIIENEIVFDALADEWVLVRGVGVGGIGDLVAANNLSDVANAATSFNNIKQAATTGDDGTVEKSTSPENIAGVAANKYPDVPGVKQMIDVHSIFTESYDSGNQTITAGGSLSLAHGLSAQPSVIVVYIKCTTADNGYAIGDEVLITTQMNINATSKGAAIWPDVTNINVRYGAAGINILNKTTGAASSIVVGSWRFIVRAYV